MKKPLVVMLIIIIAIVVIVGGGVGAFMYLTKHHSASAKASAQALTPSQAVALQVPLPQMTTNLKNQGLIQFTLILQADSKSTKSELTEMQNEIQDTVNETMRQFTPDQLKDDKGLTTLKSAISSNVNSKLQKGRVTNVYFSQVLVQ
ncbi:flagellar basal body-associated FliL family protein [Alicyclobacillus dauci]|uniref:Flagellar protein FliL n=1 Tax=Alicyclobacillus dauci TaxID=1475485 RepID=A0ABY6YXQ2_9BACL|nr:flagellar basal body-associated FliL family protein [Alicyclobacillus dauci]WAH35397.1 flagellar basal body-associated FliL family protein [Alicyclobacillus dauci]